MLPIGSIIYLAEGNQKIMILNRGALFNDKDIDEVVFEGYKDGEEERFVERYNKWKEKNSNFK